MPARPEPASVAAAPTVTGPVAFAHDGGVPDEQVTLSDGAVPSPVNETVVAAPVRPPLLVDASDSAEGSPGFASHEYVASRALTCPTCHVESANDAGKLTLATPDSGSSPA